MTQRFLIELGGSQVGRIDEDDVAEALTRLVISREHGMGSLEVQVEEIPANVRIQTMSGYEPLGDIDLVDYLDERPR